jgi:hypothetical protein
VSEEFKNTVRSVTGIWKAVMRNTVMCQRNLWIQNALCHRNLDSFNAKYGNVSEEFRNTERILSQEFGDLLDEIM